MNARLVPVPDRTPECIVPGDDHRGEVHLYPGGRLCDRHAPGPAVTRVTPGPLPARIGQEPIPER